MRLLHLPPRIASLQMEVQSREGEENGDGFDIRSGGLRRIGVDHILMNEFRATMRQSIKTERMKCFQLIHIEYFTASSRNRGTDVNE